MCRYVCICVYIYNVYIYICGQMTVCDIILYYINSMCVI